MNPPLMHQMDNPGPSHGQSHSYREFICGWGAGCIETCILFPANKLIFRQQLHGFHLKEAIKQIHAEGFSLLYRGLLPPLMMRTSTRAIMFGINEKFLNILGCPSQERVFTLCRSQAAFLAGMCEASLCPFERIQVLLQTPTYHDHFKNTADAFSGVYKEHGAREFYRGISVVITRNGLSNILFFSLREPLKKLIVDTDTKSSDRLISVLADFVSGSVLGASISTLFYPLNVVKNRMQSQLGTNYESPFQVLRQLLHERGSVKALYRGVHLNLGRSLVGWGITNTVYESLHRVITAIEG